MTLAHATAEELRVKAQAALAIDGEWYDADTFDREPEDCAFIAAASPAVVLALLDRLERAEKVSKAAQEVAEYAICSVYDPSIGYVSHVPAVYVRGLQATLAALEGES